MSFGLNRRGALSVMASGLALLAGGPLRASTLPTAYTQALAEELADLTAAQDFYATRGYASLWTGPQDADRRALALAAFDTARDHGLPVPRYDAGALRTAMAAAQTEGDLGRIEARMTKAVLSFVRDLSSGALTPSKIDDGIKREIVRPDEALTLSRLETGLGDLLSNLAPQAPEYARLMAEKFRLEDILARGGFDSAAPLSETEPGTTGPAAVALRDRLIALGYLQASFTETYDAELKAGVSRFQMAHGILPDGVVGKSTAEALNTPADARLKSVIVAMERLRWMGNAPLGARHIRVNQPEYKARVIDDGAVTFETRVIIGKTGHDTASPEFSELMEFMVINPTWSVPRSIVVKEYLPQFQKNPGAQRQLQLIDRSGRVVDRSTVDFAAYTPGNFPFALRQPPEDGNALGKVKFMFPNQWNIYLHDTPTKPLFAKEVRAFSHGCIRVGSPFDLAYVLLARQTDDPKALFKEHLDTGRETTLNFDTPIPVHLVYFTAWPDETGQMNWFRDIYGRDAKLADALAEAGADFGGTQA
ncbi:L,D-transpeptidase family protein [Rhodobacter sp. KR11]|jgi:murein L,D-transpeptidase YcbB/YkuD|uniref:L,D-transpeptidase family protein n=1 Tax=Rhodobacter sp. KR11 TaxID=2974588 RepID=UPI002221D704|nr:L,D-transpeptidase family protein [Rhodobacter sp. KR11]MCW1917755.1 L,D-transpeptidase family protein [Rhodobacter sp. KR11]